MAALPIASINGQPVHVRDIGTVELGIREDYIRTSSEHGPAVLVGVSRQPGGNTELISAAGTADGHEFRTRYPDVTFSFSYDQSALVAIRSTACATRSCSGWSLAVAVVLWSSR